MCVAMLLDTFADASMCGADMGVDMGVDMWIDVCVKICINVCIRSLLAGAVCRRCRQISEQCWPTWDVIDRMYPKLANEGKLQCHNANTNASVWLVLDRLSHLQASCRATFRHLSCSFKMGASPPLHKSGMSHELDDRSLSVFVLLQLLGLELPSS